MSDIGARIRWERISAGLTQIEFAKMVGCSVRRICLIEHGEEKTTPRMLNTIARILGVSVELLKTPMSGKISYLTLRSLKNKKRKAGIEDARIKADYRGTEEGA